MIYNPEPWIGRPGDTPDARRSRHEAFRCSGAFLQTLSASLPYPGLIPVPAPALVVSGSFCVSSPAVLATLKRGHVSRILVRLAERSAPGFSPENPDIIFLGFHDRNIHRRSEWNDCPNPARFRRRVASEMHAKPKPRRQVRANPPHKTAGRANARTARPRCPKRTERSIRAAR